MWVVVEINNAKKFEKKDVEEYVYRLKDYLKTYNLTPMEYEILKEFGFGNDVPVGNHVLGQNQGIVFYWQLKVYFNRLKHDYNFALADKKYIQQ